MGIFNRILRGVGRAVEKVTEAVAEKPTKKSGRPSERAPVSSPPPSASAERAKLATEMGSDERERTVGGEVEKENWFAALRARADKFAPGLLDALEEALDGMDPDDEILSDTEYETDKGKSP